MSRLFQAGAEDGGVGVWSAVSSGAVASTTVKRTGAYSFKLTGGTDYTVFAFSATKSVLYIKFAMYMAALPASASTMLILLDSGATVQCILGMTANGNIVITLQSMSTGLQATSYYAYTPGTWVCFEWYIKIANSPDAETTVKADGATIIGPLSGAGLDTQATAIAGANSLRFGYGSLMPGMTLMYLDDVAINDNAGAVNNSWIGRGGIYAVVPDGAGTYTDLHASTGDPFECINEVPPSDADYVYDAVVDQKSTFTLGALTPATGTIAAISVIERALLDFPGSGEIARIIRSNGVDDQGADVGLDVSAKTIMEIIELDPGDEPHSAWTIARVNALEGGAVVR